MQLTINTQAFIEQEIYSDFILRTLNDGLLGSQFYRDVADFGSGETLNIPTIGAVAIQEAEENTPLVYSPIDTGRVTLQITDYTGDAWFVTDDLREDGYNIDSLMSARSAESSRAIQENFETRFLQVCNEAQIPLDPNIINGQPHRIAAIGAGTFYTSLLVQMKLSFTKAKAPAGGRIFICDPIVEAALNNLVTVTHDVTPFGQEVLTMGMSADMHWIMNLFGWDIMSSNYLDTGSFGDGTTTIVDAVANVCMCVIDDNCKPIMAAWRRHPRVEGERNKDLRRDEFVVTARFGIGAQRVDTLGIIITDASTFLT